jgi:hypothetical protein
MDRLISEQAVIDRLSNWYSDMLETGKEHEDLIEVIKAIPSAEPKKCKDCKWWRDSDGAYRRGIKAVCPINRREVFEGNGYCYMFEPQERSDKE